ncbi:MULTISPECIES: DUF1963 domain-containing protein [Bacillus cereus group]|uniref:DUF1963 domain-containing protein n=1 Tax=Bacillus cereus group TaxID=86661 RepID=UPI001E438D66|nr:MULTISPECIES: DUF1963 domain-containing protein [Bacillus cereus group]MDA2615560.1 DUF1963 domain-containing protein [Bacillus cereus]MEB8554926.1 DUF1963 domain-containing protein [Bacillus cereus]MEB8650391.1 DUF1963 domain-containing protein [Bacillus cereus]MEB8666973.1 DUF1963 domain-containing protein [Bacillus cereus]MEB8725574.1 DUF1963 domain-containing protein [Bacillus cereus]
MSLYFIGQLNLEEVKSYHEGNPLLTKGMFYFFYDVEKEPWGVTQKILEDIVFCTQKI